jgi:glycolate oxidase
MEVVTPTGEVIRVGEGGGRKIRKSSVGYRIKDLFIGHQGTLGITTEVTLDLAPRPEAEYPVFFATRSFDDAHKILHGFNHSGIRSIAGMFAFDEWKVDFLRRDDEAWIPLPEWTKAAVAVCLYGTNEEVEGVKQRVIDIGESAGGVYMGREISEGDWASRHDRYHLAYHGRDKDKSKIKLLSWSCEDASITWSQLPEVRLKWHAVIKELTDKHPEHFDDWGIFFDIGNPFRAWGDYLSEIDIGVNEQEMTPEIWADWIEAKKEIARISIEHGGSISMAHGGTREGEVDVATYEELAEGQFDLMKKIKRLLAPTNIMNPGTYNLDDAYTEEGQA